jgi:hypothetical protein
MSKKSQATLRRLSLVALAFLCLLACGPSWQASIVAPDGSDYVVNNQVLEVFEDFASEDGGIPLERVLLAAGHEVVEQIVVTGLEGDRHDFDWAAVAGDATWQKNGRLALGDQVLPVSRIEVEPPALLDQVQVHITDLAPAAASALGLPALEDATGQALLVPRASHVLLLFLDGFGYLRYIEARDEGLVPGLAVLGEPLVGLTRYPPSTSVASASLLTGADPAVTGVDRRGIRKTEAETLFDVAAAAGLRVEAVEGDALAFNLRSAAMQLSGDRDGNGSTDDNVLANALAVLEEGMPELLYVHFHGIDDAGHSYGPNVPQEAAKIREVDAAVGFILEALPGGSLIIAFADHGMHTVQEDGRKGNHGHLIERDMFIPVFVALKAADGRITPISSLGGQ